ncbi:GNAT family N-acetyltransferase [Streptococcus sp. X16XC17]|uniref:GNAT family N-acetyltransferase n=1 Tax=unclassified Streptococcus TaxID=2608887 RepID=UPI00069D448F|nr:MULTISPECIES: GNAT family N-acetyltransferase [unclassified Streptococcus]TCD45530.1 GNAT family N-acetyltransferase [Streptococcus sp. X16XC17]
MIREAIKQDGQALAVCLAEFRTALRRLKGIERPTSLEDAQEEVDYFLENDFPVYIAEVAGEIMGYLVCKVSDGTVWVEQIFVVADHRRKGFAQSLFEKAELLAQKLGGETVFNNVHPNNDKMISF